MSWSEVQPRGENRKMHHSSLFGPLFLASSGNTTALPECGDVPTHASLFHIAAGCLETISVMLGKFIFPALGSFFSRILSHCTHTGCPTAPAADTNHKPPQSSLHTTLFPSATRIAGCAAQPLCLSVGVWTLWSEQFILCLPVAFKMKCSSVL